MNNPSSLFKKLFSHKEKEQGFDEKDILKTEKRLGIKLPHDLRLFYLHQVKNTLINSCHYFAAPDELFLDGSEHLVFYGENQGIWAISYHLNNGHIYINYEQMGFEKEAESLKDFFIVRAASDYCQYIYSFQIYSDDANLEDVEILKKHFPALKSEINPPNYLRKRLFWDTADEVFQIIQFPPQNYNGKILVHVMTQKEETINKIKNLNLQLNWKNIKKNGLKSSVNLRSYLKDG